MSPTAASAHSAPPTAPAEPVGGVYQTTLERAFGRIFAAFMALMVVVVFWSSSATLAGVASRPLPWSVVVSKARGAKDSLARQVPRGGYGFADLESALRRRANPAPWSATSATTSS